MTNFNNFDLNYIHFTNVKKLLKFFKNHIQITNKLTDKTKYKIS